MGNQFMLNSIAIGAAIFVGLIMFWFVFVYLKRRMRPESSNTGSSKAIQASWAEKRRHPRVEIKWQGFIESPQQNVAVQLKDISLGGAFVICPQLPTSQDQFTITLHLPGGGSVSLNAVMVWSNFNMPTEKVVNRGMGIKFTNNEDKERRQLHDAIVAVLDQPDDQAD